MTYRSALLRSAACTIAFGAMLAIPAAADEGVETVVVTAQKISQNINDVGMSVQAASGDDLLKLGITDTSQLVKLIPGFNYAPSFYGTPIYAIRGVGFLTTSLAASPTVSVYVDQAPLPYSIMTVGAVLDLERVEVLKGPQGTLYGENATGGAINYIAAKPTDEFKAGADLSWGRFNSVDLQGFLSGPVTDEFAVRIAARVQQSDDWQYSYTHPATSGAKNLWEARASFEWKPTEDFTALLTVAGYQDRSDTQMPALFGIAVLSPVSGLDPRIGVFPFAQFGTSAGSHYPFAPHDPRAADWSECVNSSPFDPPFDTTPIGSVRPEHSDVCVPAANNNRLVNPTLRLDWNFDGDTTLTSLSSYDYFKRYSAIEGDGTIYQDYESIQQGYIETMYQELRLTGKFGGLGDWIMGANFERDKTYDHFLQTYGGSTANPTAIPGAAFCAPPFGPATGFLDCSTLSPLQQAQIISGAIPQYYLTTLGPTEPTNRQNTEAYAIFANAEYPITDELTLQAGARYTQTNMNSHGCGFDGGDGTWSRVSQQIQNLLELLNGVISPATYLQPGTSGGFGVDLGPGACSTSGPGPTFNPQPFYAANNENNVSWRVGANWKPNETTLLYANISQGWKSGSFPTVATSAFTQLVPATQEGLLAYEVGGKVTLLDGNLQLNGAAFYYDYKDKQLLGALIDPVFGPLPKLVNVPKSHVVGFELQATWRIDGLTLAPMVSYAHSRVDGCSTNDPAGPGCHGGRYFNFDPFSQLVDLTGEAFPAAPEWQADIDASYEWKLDDELTAFVGANLNYQASTNGFFYNRAAYTPFPGPSANAFPPDVLNIPEYALLDLRAGVERDSWRFQVWGRNVTNKYYWTGSAHVNDVLYRYTGMPATWGFTLSYRME